MSNFINIIGPFVLPVLMIALSVVAVSVCLYFSLRLIKGQIKLYNSITLVPLKSPKLRYFVFILPISFFIIYLSFQMMDAHSPEVLFFAQVFLMQRWQTNLMIGFLIGLLLSVEFLLLVLLRSKCAVVDKGIYTPLKFLDWYNVHGYIIDEKKCIVILGSDKGTFSTVKGTMTPLRLAKNDIAKLKFILNKNKNKFSKFKGTQSDSFDSIKSTIDLQKGDYGKR